MDVLLFYIFAAVAIVASLLVIGQGNPMHSVMLLIVSFGALAGLYVLLDAPFTAVTQIIVYAGAIMVLFLFVVMLLNVPREESLMTRPSALLGPTGMRIGVVLSVLPAPTYQIASAPAKTLVIQDDDVPLLSPPGLRLEIAPLSPVPVRSVAGH